MDGDLTGIPVSNTSTTYPNAAFGHMDDDIQLGYQAGVVSLLTETYGRLWLWGTHHPGDTVSSTQAEALVLAAEGRIGLRPLRRTDFSRKTHHQLRCRVWRRLGQTKNAAKKHWNCAGRFETSASTGYREERQTGNREQAYQTCKRPERPTSQLALLRKRFQAAQRRCESRKKAYDVAQRKLTKTQERVHLLLNEISALRQRLERFKQENLTNKQLIQAEFRLDAGFGATTTLLCWSKWATKFTQSPTATK